MYRIRWPNAVSPSTPAETATPTPPPPAPSETAKPAPKRPVPSQPAKSIPRDAKEVCILPGTIYELRLPSLPLPNETSAELLAAEGERVQKLYAGKIAEVRRRYAEDAQLSAEIPKLEQVYEMADALWGFSNNGSHLILSLSSEASYRMHTAHRPMSREEFAKAYQERNRQSLEFLKRYSAKEQAEILYYSARRDEQCCGMTVKPGMPDTVRNREIWERNYRAWAECHARMMKARRDLLPFR